MNELHLFDLDYTLFKTDAKVALYTNGEFERWFRGAKEYHAHQKIANDSHVYDFSQYISSHDFRQQAKPIQPIIDKAIEAINDPNCHVALVTARNTMHDLEIFKEVFFHHGMDPNRIEFNFCGDIRDTFGRSNITAPQAKKMCVDSYIIRGNYDLVRMYDDLKENLDEVATLKLRYPHIEFDMIHVKGY